jgi:hypothetical protein
VTLEAAALMDTTDKSCLRLESHHNTTTVKTLALWQDRGGRPPPATPVAEDCVT